jgi:hypothetical protein
VQLNRIEEWHWNQFSPLKLGALVSIEDFFMVGEKQQPSSPFFLVRDKHHTFQYISG